MYNVGIYDIEMKEQGCGLIFYHLCVCVYVCVCMYVCVCKPLIKGLFTWHFSSMLLM